ncbi:MAG TPA: methyltransferase domain-containing protein [Terriglobales bacterium]|nr:methyltransferase domain-containing protein [Terriglobales bacterium]
MGANLEVLDRLNLGCGPDAPSAWVNVDGSWNAWFSHHRRLRRILELIGIINSGNQGAKWNVSPLVHDLRKRLPFHENTFSAIYASHVLEHLYRSDAQALLCECRRVLRPGGTLRVVVPDLHSMVVDYLNRRRAGTMSAADNLNARLAFRSPAPPAGNVFVRSYAVWKDFHSHKWMYDSDSLIHYLEAAGFHQVAQMEFLKSSIPGIEEVEQPERVLDGAGICIEGKKPLG